MLFVLCVSIDYKSHQKLLCVVSITFCRFFNSLHMLWIRIFRSAVHTELNLFGDLKKKVGVKAASTVQTRRSASK